MIETGRLIERIDRATAHAERLRHAGVTPSGFASVRPRHMGNVLQVLDDGVNELVREGSRHDPLVAGRLLALADVVGAHPAAEHPAVRHRARLAQGRVHAFRLDWRAADAAIGDLVFRPHAACGDRDAVRAAMLLDRAVRPNLVEQQPALAALFLERLLFLMSRFGGFDERLELLEAFGQQLAILLAGDATRSHVASVSGVADAVLASFPSALAYLRIRRGWPQRTANPRKLVYRLRGGQPFRTLLGALIGVADQRHTFALSRSRPDGASPHGGRTLVTRGTDDLGDVLMMLPALKALARRSGGAVHCAVPGRLLPLLRDVPGIVPLATEADIPYDTYDAWFDLDACHDARPESGRARVEVFAAALGVGDAELDQQGRSQPLALDPSQLAMREAIRQEARSRGWPVVGIAPFGRDEARAVPALVGVAERLAGTCLLRVLHPHQVEALDTAGLRVPDTPDLASLVATIAACDYVIATDAPQLHLAAALGVPTLAIVGPTDGRLRAAPSSPVRLMRTGTHCPAMPCWRTDDQPCAITLGPTSACLAELREEDILREFDELVAAHPIAGDRVRPALAAA